MPIRTRKKQVKRHSWKFGREPITIDIPVDLEKALKKLARKSGIGYTQFASMVLEDQVRKRIKLEELIEAMVRQAFGEEMSRSGSRKAPFPNTLQEKKAKRKLPN